MEKFEIKTEDQKQEAISKLTQLEAVIEKSLEYDLPVDHLFEQKGIIKDAIADYNANRDTTEPGDKVKDEAGNQDAPFHRVFLLIEVDQENVNDAYDHIYRNCPWCYGIRAFEEV